MDGDEIDRCPVRFCLTLVGVCVARATFITTPPTAAQNELEETVATGSRIRQNPTLSPVPGRFFHARVALEF
jgi:hypothetical protein